MPDALVDAAPWIALACLVVAIAIAAYTGWRTWQQWTRVSMTQEAATALLDVHRERLDEAIALANERTGVIADGGEELAEALAELKADAAHLSWMLGRIPEERDRLRRAIGDLVLHTPDGDRDD